MPTEQWLEMVEVHEISLVPDASNPLSDVVFVKSAKSGKSPKDERFTKLGAILSEASARKSAEAGIAKIGTGFSALTAAVTAIGGLTDVHKSKIIAALGNFEAVLGDLVPTVVVSKAVAESMMAITEDGSEGIAKEIVMLDIETLKAALAKAEGDLATATATITKHAADIATLTADKTKLADELSVAKAALPGAKDEDIYKGLPAAAVAHMKKMADENAANTALIQKMGDDAAISALATTLKAAGVPDFDKVAGAVHRIEKGRAVATATVEGKEVPGDVEIVKAAMVMKAKATKAPMGVKGADNVVLFGKSAESSIVEGETAFTKMNKAAEEIVAKEGAGKITKEAAFVKVMDSDPTLYAQYLEEKKVGVRG